MAENQKLDTLLQVALELTRQERVLNDNLNAGFDAGNQTWELIVKYNGDLRELETDNIMVEPLLAGYGIVTLPQSLIPYFASLDQVEYIEKPKLLFPQTEEGIRASCVWEIQRQSPNLTGEGVYIGIIDSGITYSEEAFLDEGGRTRIEALYDQNQERIFTEEEINEALESGNESLSIDVTGHGTAVANIATGRGGRNQGVAYNSKLLVVKLAVGNQQSYPLTTSLLRGIYFLVNYAREQNKPIAINLSFGNTYGSHDGHSLVERFLDNATEYGRNVICVGSGNEGTASGHTSGKVGRGETERAVPFFVGEYETQFSVQLWKRYEDEFEIQLISPGGEQISVPFIDDNSVTIRRQLEDTEVILFVGQPQPYSTSQEIYFQLQPLGRYIDSGIWEIILSPVSIVTGEYSMYLQSLATRNSASRFLEPQPERTFTIPSTAELVITVGAYDTRYNTYADFSGRGYVSYQQNNGESRIAGVKPDIVAPGVGIRTSNGREEVTVNGTSFATPFVTGSAALMMEWGIVKGNDPYLYGEKLKAYLIKGARRLPGFDEYPNPQVGWGALCVSDSLPRG